MPAKIKRILLFITAAILLMSCHINASDERRTVRVGYYINDGFQSKDENGNYNGYGYEYITELAKYANWELEFIEHDFPSCLEMLENGDIDLLAGVYDLPSRRKIYEYSNIPSGTWYSALTTRISNNRLHYHDYESFNGIKIGFVTDTDRDEGLQHQADKYNFSYTKHFYSDSSHLYEALENGEIDAAAAPDSYVSENEKLLLKYDHRNHYIITAKGNTALTDEINNKNIKK